MAKETKKEQQQVFAGQAPAFRYVDQVDRWRQENERAKVVEETLSKLSILDYREVDYYSQLEIVLFQEKPVPNFDDLLEENRLLAQGKFFMPIAYRAGIIAFLLLILVLSPSTFLMWIIACLLLTVFASLFFTVQDRQQTIQKVVVETKEEIKRRIEYHHKTQEEARKKHEVAEQERVAAVERLLSGDVGAILLKMDVALSSLEVGFSAEVNIDLLEGVPLFQIWLPPKAIIPTQVCTLSPGGRPAYEDKEIRTVNKQYIELCAALIMQVLSRVYEVVPTLDRSYVMGMSKSALNNECYIHLSCTRNEVMQACQATKGLLAIQQLQAVYNADPMLNLLPIKEIQPEEWGNEVNLQALRSLHVRLKTPQFFNKIPLNAGKQE